MTFIEIDHPATQRIKAPCVTQPETGLLKNLHCLALDFTQQTLEHELTQCPVFSSDKPTLFICEGVLPYLTENHVTALFSSLKQLCRNSLSFIFTALEPTRPSLLKIYLQQKSEPFRWEMASHQLSDFVTAQGFVLDDISTEKRLCERYINTVRPQILFEQEYLALANR